MVLHKVIDQLSVTFWAYKVCNKKPNIKLYYKNQDMPKIIILYRQQGRTGAFHLGLFTRSENMFVNI